MRIAMLAWESLHSVSVGGGAVHVSELAAALARKGHDVHVFTRIAPGQDDYDCIDGVHYYRTPYKGHHEFVDDVNNMCRAFVHRLFGVEDSTGKRFDIVHAHDWLCANAMIWIKKGRQRAGVLTIHATEFGRCGNVFHDGRSARVRDQERAGCDWADRVIAVSGATRDEVKWMYEVPQDKAAVVYNGVSRKRFDRHVDVEAVRKRYSIGPLDPVVFFCGRLAYQKGPDILLEAFPAVYQRYRHAKLVLAGDGSMRAQLERRARELGLVDAVRFMGHRSGDELVDLFKISDVVAVPSRNEPFGIVVLEAWSASKPVIVTHTGGPAEYVTHEVNGLRVYENPGSVGWGLGRVCDDFEFARRMGRNGREAVEQGFTWDIVAQQTLEVYQSACQAIHGKPVAEPEAEPALPDHAAQDAAADPNAEPEIVALSQAGTVNGGQTEAGKPSPTHVRAMLSWDEQADPLDPTAVGDALRDACDELDCRLITGDAGGFEIVGTWPAVMGVLQRLEPVARDLADRVKLDLGIELIRQQRAALNRATTLEAAEQTPRSSEAPAKRRSNGHGTTPVASGSDDTQAAATAVRRKAKRKRPPATGQAS